MKKEIAVNDYLKMDEQGKNLVEIKFTDKFSEYYADGWSKSMSKKKACDDLDMSVVLGSFLVRDVDLEPALKKRELNRIIAELKQKILI